MDNRHGFQSQHSFRNGSVSFFIQCTKQCERFSFGLLFIFQSFQYAVAELVRASSRKYDGKGFVAGEQTIFFQSTPSNCSVGIHQIVVIAVNASDCFFSFNFVNPSCEEFTLNNFQMFFFNFVAAFSVQLIHQGINFFCVFIGDCVKQTFQVTGNKNIHGRRNGFEEFTAFIINTGIDEISKYVVTIRCAQQTFYRQAHQLSIVAGKNVTKVTGGNNKVNTVTHFNATCFNSINISTKIVNDLRYKASPVNGVRR